MSSSCFPCLSCLSLLSLSCIFVSLSCMFDSPCLSFCFLVSVFLASYSSCLSLRGLASFQTMPCTSVHNIDSQSTATPCCFQLWHALCSVVHLPRRYVAWPPLLSVRVLQNREYREICAVCAVTTEIPCRWEMQNCKTAKLQICFTNPNIERTSLCVCRGRGRWKWASTIGPERRNHNTTHPPSPAECGCRSWQKTATGSDL